MNNPTTPSSTSGTNRPVTAGRVNADIEASPNAPKTEEFTGKAHELLDKLSKQVAAAEDRVRAAASEAQVQAKQSGDTAALKADESLEQLTAYIKEKPLHAFGAAVLGGALLGAILKR